MQQLKIKLPEVYHKFLPELIEKEFPEEKLATCNQCIYGKGKDSYKVNTKCCVYFPHEANYFVGGILSDNNKSLEEGKKRIKERITQKIGVTPYGIIPPKNYKIRSKSWQERKPIRHTEPLSLRKTERQSLVCPYFDEGNCTIWAYREHCCSTYFCESVGGADGKNFWNNVDQYLKTVEKKLTTYALLKIGWPKDQLSNFGMYDKSLNIDDDKGLFSEVDYKKQWGAWYGKEEELYIKTYNIITQLTQEDYKNIVGLTEEILKSKIEKSLELFIEPAIPKYLRLNSKLEIIKTENSYALKTAHGSQIVNENIYSILQEFNGKKQSDEICKQFPLIKLSFNGESLLKSFIQKRFLVDATI